MRIRNEELGVRNWLVHTLLVVICFMASMTPAMAQQNSDRTPWRQSRPDCPGRLRSYTMKRLDDNSDLLKILRCAFETYNTLKSGYLESVYEAALEYELLQAGFSVSRQVRIPVFYKGVELRKDFYADMVVNDCILLELKAVSSLNAAHERQLVSYMKSTGIQEGMLLNFGNVRRLEWRVNSP